MAYSKLPGVHVDEASISDFVDGIFGVNRERNQQAWRAGAKAIAIAALLPSLKRKKKRGKK